MLILGQKGQIWTKKAQNGLNQVFPVLSLGFFINTPKIQLKYAKLRRSYDSFPRNWQKMSIFGPRLAQNGPNGIFRAKSENVTSITLGSPNFVPKIQIILSTDFEISAGRTVERTDGRRLNHKSQPRCGGPKTQN